MDLNKKSCTTLCYSITNKIHCLVTKDDANSTTKYPYNVEQTHKNISIQRDKSALARKEGLITFSSFQINFSTRNKHKKQIKTEKAENKNANYWMYNESEKRLQKCAQVILA